LEHAPAFKRRFVVAALEIYSLLGMQVVRFCVRWGSFALFAAASGIARVAFRLSLGKLAFMRGLSCKQREPLNSYLVSISFAAWLQPPLAKVT
jgi:hypothetical protein